MTANSIVKGCLTSRFLLVIIVIVGSLNAVDAKKKTPVEPAFTTQDQYGFLHPTGYTYADSSKYVFTRHFSGNLNFTFGNWETDIDMQTLPKLQLIMKANSKQNKDQTDAEYEKSREDISRKVIQNINYQTKYEPFYRANIFKHDNPAFFSPDLDGYMHIMSQLSGVYTQIGKMYLYGMLMIGMFILSASKYFKQIDLDDVPRSQNNKIKDKFFKISKKRAEGQRAYNSWGICFGFTMVCIFGLFWVQICFNNSTEIRRSAGNLFKEIINIEKDLVKTSEALNDINTPALKIHQSVSGGDNLTVKSLIGSTKKEGKEFEKKANDFYTSIMGKLSMSQPSNMYIILATILCTFGFCYYLGYTRQRKYISLFGFFVTVLCGTMLIFLMGSLVTDVYLLKELCTIVITNDTKLQNKEIVDIKKTMSNIAEYHLEKYLHCYNFDFNESIKTQVLNIDVAQLALFKASKIVLSTLDDTLAKNSGINKEPKTVMELINAKTKYSKLEKEQSFVTTYIKKIEKLNTIKKVIIQLPNCRSLGPWFADFAEDICVNIVNEGQVLFWLTLCVFVGTVWLSWSYLRNEILNKILRDAILFQPAQHYMRYANHTSKNLDELEMKDEG